MRGPTEGIGAATVSRRGAFSPQNDREGRAQGDTSGQHTGMRKRAGTTILNANGATIETNGDSNDNSREYKNRKTVPYVTALRFTGMT